jgi:hypothetical protein
MRRFAIVGIQMFLHHGSNIEGLRHRAFAACPQAALYSHRPRRVTTITPKVA